MNKHIRSLRFLVVCMLFPFSGSIDAEPYHGFFAIGGETQLVASQQETVDGGSRKVTKNQLVYSLPIQFSYLNPDNANPLGHIAAVGVAIKLGYVPSADFPILMDVRTDFPWAFYYSPTLVLSTGLGGGLTIGLFSRPYGVWTWKAVYLGPAKSMLHFTYDYDPFNHNHRFDGIGSPFGLPLGLEAYYEFGSYLNTPVKVLGGGLLWYVGN